MEIARRIGVERQIKLIVPAEIEPRAAQRIIAQLRAGMTFRQIGCVGCNFIGDNAGFHVVAVRQTEMLLRGDIAQHRRAEPADHRRANRRSDMVVARRDVGR